LVDLSDHQSAVNVARFSPCGRMIASASDKLIVIYSISSSKKWEDITDFKMVNRSFLRPHLNEIFDLTWSPDSLYIAAGALDAKGEIIRIATRDNIALTGHNSYVQGVAWDPLNKFVATNSCDRTCKLHMVCSLLFNCRYCVQ
jgi:chromatin assembly factor 1 subunit B